MEVRRRNEKIVLDSAICCVERVLYISVFGRRVGGCFDNRSGKQIYY